MPKRIGFLYEKMADRTFIRKTILEAAYGRKSRFDIAKVLADLDGYVERTYQMIVTESYEPSLPKEHEIYDASSQKTRRIQVVPFWPDGVMQWLVVSAMKPILMRNMFPWSCASVPGRGGIRIHRKIRSVLRTDKKGTRYAMELDVAKFYASISVKRLMWLLARKIKDKRFLRLIYRMLQTCGGGLGIGYYLCQWMANYYLEAADWFLYSLPGVKYVVRYMDNYTVFGPNKKLLHKARKQFEAYLKERLGLTMKGNWQVYPVDKRMVSAVGYRFARTHVILRKRNFLRLTRQCRRVQKRLDAGKSITLAQAAGLLSRIGQLAHCNSYNVIEKYINPIGIKRLKEVVRNESKRRRAA